MKLTITDLGGGQFDIQQFDPDSMAALVSEWESGPPVLIFATDDGMAYIPKRSVARMDVFWNDPPAPDNSWGDPPASDPV